MSAASLAGLYRPHIPPHASSSICGQARSRDALPMNNIIDSPLPTPSSREAAILAASYLA